MRIDVPRIVIAAPASGCGKSTVSTGLMAALTGELCVQGFKVGPDYIDPGYHTAATGRVSRNLDTWMVSPPQVAATFVRATRDADLAIVEGVMGLYDGYDAATERGSTAEVAKLLRAPVILILDVSKLARSAGALALGYRDYDRALQVAGVICNRVAGERHARWVTEAVEAIGLPVFGCLPRAEALHIPERHLGLHMAIEREGEMRAFLQGAAAQIREHVDLSGVLRAATEASPLEVDGVAELGTGPTPTGHDVRLAVAHDEAFCFYYADNLDLLRQAGAEIAPFSPLRDDALPEGAAGVYLGGGCPELYAERLAANSALRRALWLAHAEQMPIYAECGGLMYLTESVTDLAGLEHPMVGLLPGRSRMSQRLTMGYRLVTAAGDTLLLPAAAQARGHEFHYSDWIGGPPTPPPAYRIEPRPGEEARSEGAALGSLLASYVHLHFAAHPGIAPRFVAACAAWQAAHPKEGSQP